MGRGTGLAGETHSLLLMAQVVKLVLMPLPVTHYKKVKVLLLMAQTLKGMLILVLMARML